MENTYTASEGEPFIRHAIVAVGALAKPDNDRRECTRTRALASNLPKPTYALRKYHQAIRGLQELMSRHGSYDTRNVLIACLVFCFETLQGNLASAISHAEKGLMLFYESVRPCHQSPTITAATKHLERQMNEGDLVHGCAGLDLYIMFWRDTRSEELHRAIVTMQNAQIAQMPRGNMDMTVARGFWLLMARRNYHFFKIAAKDAARNAPQPYLRLTRVFGTARTRPWSA